MRPGGGPVGPLAFRPGGARSLFLNPYLIMTRITLQTEVELTPGIIARAFARMDGAEQATFFALAFKEMETYEKNPGSYGRQLQMLAIVDEIKKSPDAMEWFKDMNEFLWPTEEEPDDFAPAPGETLVFAEPADLGFAPRGTVQIKADSYNPTTFYSAPEHRRRREARQAARAFSASDTDGVPTQNPEAAGVNEDEGDALMDFFTKRAGE